MTRWLETDTLSNQDISSALAVGAYTADADRFVLLQMFVDQVVGADDYIFYLTHQVAGAGSHYRYLPITTGEAAAGVLAIAGLTLFIPVRLGDVLTVYVDGPAGDNATPDTIVRWWELAALRPTVADRTVDVDADGGVEVDTLQAGAIAAAAFAAGAIDAAAIADGAIDNGALADAAITAAKIAADAITAAKIATDAIGADELAAAAIAEISAAIWGAVSRTLTTPAATEDEVAATELPDIVIGTTYSRTLSGLTIPATWTKCYITLKDDPDNQADTAATAQILESNPHVGTDGLQVLKGTTSTAALAGLTVTQAAGTVAILITDNATSTLTKSGKVYWDCKVLKSDGSSERLAWGEIGVVSTPTRTI